MKEEIKGTNQRYYVDDIVCDYAVIDRLSHEEEDKLVCICNSRANALLIADILNTDYYPDETGFIQVYEAAATIARLKAENEELKKEVEKHRYWHIEHFKGEKEWKHKALYDVPRETRKQVCAEIRKYDICTNKQTTSYTDYVSGLCERLKQIEKGGV